MTLRYVYLRLQERAAPSSCGRRYAGAQKSTSPNRNNNNNGPVSPATTEAATIRRDDVLTPSLHQAIDGVTRKVRNQVRSGATQGVEQLDGSARDLIRESAPSDGNNGYDRQALPHLEELAPPLQATAADGEVVEDLPEQHQTAEQLMKTQIDDIMVLTDAHEPKVAYGLDSSAMVAASECGPEERSHTTIINEQEVTMKNYAPVTEYSLLYGDAATMATQHVPWSIMTSIPHKGTLEIFKQKTCNDDTLLLTPADIEQAVTHV